MKKALEGPTLSIDTADTKEAALALLGERAYDFVLADVRLGGSLNEDGLDILKHVKEHARGTKVIIVTGFASAGLRERAMAMGAALLLEKPVRSAALKAAIEALGGRGNGSHA
jgi:DNA-binding NtrC family response regulator